MTREEQLRNIRGFVEALNEEAPKAPELVKEGNRLADEFRKSYASVSDEDLGSLVLVFTTMLAYFMDLPVRNAGATLDNTFFAYAYASGQLLRTEIDF
jgi:hypothetical protein